MRLHHLEVRAFGPFPETVRVDFDALSEAGLFLLSGATGAGKSSILDAVCFALYGDVPGDRSSAKRLRCDQAAEGVAPRVVLEATLAGRRYRIDRSPAWTRAKRRGTGTTTEQARVVLSERVDGEWVPLSTRLDETGHLVSDRVGLTLAQFCQVAMLPQGRFQAFLRARSEERHALLRQVFRTGRFDQVERWLRERRVTLRRACATHEECVADLVSRLSEVVATPAPAEWQESPTALTDWVTGVQDSAEQEVATSADAHAAAATALAAARSAAEEAHQLAERQQRRADAVAELARLALETDAVDDACAKLDTDRRAAAVRPLVSLADDAVRRADDAAATLARAVAGVAAVLGEEVDSRRLAEIRHATLAGLADVARVRPVQDRLAALRLDTAGVADALDGLQARLAQAEARAQLLPTELEEVRDALADVEAAGARSDELHARLTELRERRAAHLRAEELTSELVRAETDLAETVTALQSAKESWLDVREQRLDGMAAEIASALVVGGCCPVCGSCDHPAPASRSTGAPDAAAERAARRVVDDLEVTAEARTQHVRDLDTRRATALARAGADPHEIEQEIATTVEALHDARALVARADAARERAARLAEEQRTAVAELERLRSDVSRRGSELARLEALAAELEEQVGAVLADRGHSCLDDLATHLTCLEKALAGADQARERHARAEHGASEALVAADRAALEAGFDSSSDAVARTLPASQRAALEARVERHRRDHDRASHVLADPVLTACAGLPAPDVAALDAACAVAVDEAARSRRFHENALERHRRAARLGTELADAVAAWRPVQQELELTAGLASFVEGRSPDNRLQMRLSAYVLAHRLGQVVDAANLRLAAMSDQRYSLVHTGRRGAGESRGGLSLLVRDDWSGESRDPVTLSGGETFVVSLALALGLADVISAEAGGSELETLFVDEGFGSLDADTLDDVMDTLDSLRDGGRVVGVVSHVPELQTRIPTQLRVQKSRQGSRAGVRLG